MFLLVGIAVADGVIGGCGGGFVFEGFFAFDPGGGIAGAFGADDAFADTRFGAVDLAAHAHHSRAVRIFVLNGEVVVYVTIGGIGADLAAAHAVGADGVGVHGPVDDVDVMDMLFDDVIAGEPGEIEPVAQLPFHVGPA